jgi:hypothetical protein
MLERLFREVKGRTRVAGVFPDEMSAHAGYRDSLEEHRAVGAETLPHDGRPRGSRKTEATTLETLTADRPPSRKQRR